MKLVVLDGYASNPGDLSWEKFNEFGEVEVYERTKPEDVHNLIKDADAVFANKVMLNEDNLKGTNVKYIGVIATGFDIVDIKYCKENNIVVTNVPDYSSNAVCQMVFAHLLNYVNRVDHYAKEIRDGRWQESKDFCFYLNTIHDLAGKTFGIYGYGNIGHMVEKVATAFGMDVIVCEHKNNAGENIKPVDEFLAKSDIISLHAPLIESSRNFVNKENLDKMKDGVIIINTARGPLVNEEDLRDALESGKVQAYLTDVLSKEPMQKPHPLEGREDVYMTPHIAWASYESRVRLMDILYENFKAFTEGKSQNVVSKWLIRYIF